MTLAASVQCSTPSIPSSIHYTVTASIAHHVVVTESSLLLRWSKFALPPPSRSYQNLTASTSHQLMSAPYSTVPFWTMQQMQVTDELAM